ncbi:hypothetical protein [Hyphomicrobium sp.]|uniref:hypothetical protein n=1 Tax=Hyphomicrobium sp. TaxID=82 RepID=UPI002E31A521|nr:hypothetical protein [Hyphomicrobium sp.]HEX2839969.1 hypothetical protein [Hyphomicrobium sp.]
MRYLLWVPLLGVVFAVYELVGLPHLCFSYEFSARSIDPIEKRHYHSCTFVGPYGRWTETAVSGRCPWLRWKRSDVVS